MMKNWQGLAVACGVMIGLAGTGWGQMPPHGGQAGKVVETMDAGGYTYVGVEVGDKVVWAATTKFDVAVGDSVVIPSGGLPMRNFESPSLGRKFDEILFVGGIMVGGAGHGAGAAPVGMGGMSGGGAVEAGALPAGHPPISGGRPTSMVAEEVGVVTPPEAGMQIAEVYARHQELAGQPVTVRGRVVKYNGNVLGCNWIHLQDGSGAAGEGTHDLTVTTDAVAAVGDLITVTGTVTLDRDFGYGYAYPVLVEKAAIVSE